ncbi:hypothetical protein [Chromatium okenii]|uniref:hypothetical protein n=1 Tax=Chromatium okenii TaxID=61644 RepID=UPI0015590D08|nr:hypothetical protein [Chromatium okenii]
MAAESGDESRAKAAFENAISGATHAIEKELGIANDNLIALGERLTAAAWQ